MTRLKLSALMLGATALTMPLGMSAYAQTNQQNSQGQQQASNQQNAELGACEKLYRLVDEAAGEDILEQFKNAPNVAERNEADSCALVIKKIGQAGGISKQAVAEGRGTEFLTDTDTFRATDTVSQTVEIDRKAVVAGKVTVKQPIPEVDVSQGNAEVQVQERPGRIDVNEEPASILVRQRAANVRVAVPRPTVVIDQPAPEIIVTMPAPGLDIQRDQPEVNVVMAKPTVKVRQEDPQVDVDVDARLVQPGVAVAENEPGIQTSSQRVNAQGKTVTDQDAEVTVKKVKPSIRFMTADVQDEVHFSRANPQIRYEAAEPNVEVTFNDEPRVEIHQTGEPKVRIRRKGDQQSMNGGGQQNRQANAQQGGQQSGNAQGNRQASQQSGNQQASNAQNGGDQFQANVVRAEDAVLRVNRRVQSATRALEQSDMQRARADVQRASQQLDIAMRTADDDDRQQLQALSDQLDLVVVALDDNDARGAETALYDVETNLQQNRDRWGLGDEIQQTANAAGNAIGEGVETVGEGVAAAGATVANAGREVGQRLSLDDTNRLLGEGYREGVQTDMINVAAGDLENLDVFTVNGEKIGDIDRIVSNGNRNYAIIEHGGFLGIGEDEVAIPADRIAIRGDNAILLGLSENDIEAMPEYDARNQSDLAADDTVQIGRFE